MERGINFMKIKKLLLISYSLVGLLIASLSALMTYLIIGEPIGMKMLSKITLSVVLLLPFVVLVSIYIAPKIEKYIAKLQSKNQELNTMLSSLAHDTKTPLTIINGYLEEIEDGLISQEELSKTIAKIKKETHYIDELVVDILSYLYSMESNTQSQTLNLHEIFADEILPLLNRTKEVDMINEISLDFVIVFNKVALKKIAINIIDNAQRYTKSGYIKIYTQEGIIYFENSGEMIPQEFHEKIFDPFFTIDESRGRAKSGAGLGLAIVQNLAKANGYSCFVEYSDDKITRFGLKRS